MTVFAVYLNDVKHMVDIPEHRVETIIDRFDKYSFPGNFKKAYSVIEEFIVNDDAKTAKTEVKEVAKTDRRIAVAKIISENPNMDDSNLIKLIVNELGITYANARYYVKKG